MGQLPWRRGDHSPGPDPWEGRFVCLFVFGFSVLARWLVVV